MTETERRAAPAVERGTRWMGVCVHFVWCVVCVCVFARGGGCQGRRGLLVLIYDRDRDCATCGPSSGAGHKMDGSVCALVCEKAIPLKGTGAGETWAEEHA